MADKFDGSDGVMAPARSAAAVTPHDTNALANVSKALYVGGAGNIACRLVDASTDVTFTGIPAGTVLPIRVSHVRSTSTTATSIVSIY